MAHRPTSVVASDSNFSRSATTASSSERVLGASATEVITAQDSKGFRASVVDIFKLVYVMASFAGRLCLARRWASGLGRGRPLGPALSPLGGPPTPTWSLDLEALLKLDGDGRPAAATASTATTAATASAACGGLAVLRGLAARGEDAEWDLVLDA